MWIVLANPFPNKIWKEYQDSCFELQKMQNISNFIFANK